MGSTASEALLVSSGDGWTRLTLNRPSLRNALDLTLLGELNRRLKELHEKPPALLILDAHGPHFCAGADLTWMGQSPQDTSDEAPRQLQQLLQQLDTLPTLTLACVHGATLGGGVGLLACCDRVIADPHSWIRLPEVSLGLLPALILPYLYRCVGERHCRDWCLGGQRIDAGHVLQAGLFQQLQPKDQFAEALAPLMASATATSLPALQACKRWILAQRDPHAAGLEALDWLNGARRHTDTQRRIRAVLNQAKE